MMFYLLVWFDLNEWGIIRTMQQSQSISVGDGDMIEVS